jgi:hypothetical protein
MMGEICFKRSQASKNIGKTKENQIATLFFFVVLL